MSRSPSVSRVDKKGNAPGRPGIPCSEFSWVSVKLSFRAIDSQGGLAELLAFLQCNNEPDDVMHVVNGRIWNRGEIQVSSLYIGAVHPIEPLPDLRWTEDVAGRHLEHRAKLLGRKNVIIAEAYLTSAILRSCKDVERDNELMGFMLVWQLSAR